MCGGIEGEHTFHKFVVVCIVLCSHVCRFRSYWTQFAGPVLGGFVSRKWCNVGCEGMVVFRMISVNWVGVGGWRFRFRRAWAIEVWVGGVLILIISVIRWDSLVLLVKCTGTEVVLQQVVLLAARRRAENVWFHVGQ